MRNRIGILISLFLFAGVMLSQQQPASSAPSNAQSSMPGMDMSGHDMAGMQMKGTPTAADKDGEKDSDASAHAMHSMEGHMDMGPPMGWTERLPAKPGEAGRAKAVVMLRARPQKNTS